MRLRVGITFLPVLFFMSFCDASAASDARLAVQPAQRAVGVSAISIEAPPVVNAAEGSSISITATAGSGDPRSIVNIQVDGEPPGLTLTASGFLSRIATLSGVLGFETAGTWTLSWTVRDQFGAYDSTATQLVVENTENGGNLAPIAEAGGPYSGLVGAPLTMRASGSYDPDGDALFYSWEFGDGGTGAGVTVSHSYITTGTFIVRLVASDGPLFDEDETTALVVQGFAANVFVTDGNRILRLNSGKPRFCVEIEPERRGFNIEDADLGSFEMVYGSSRISAMASLGGDMNRNGIQEITACFSKEDLRHLFPGLPAGVNEVAVTIEGRHNAGNPITGSLSLTVVVRDGLSVSVAPNPLNPVGTLTLTTSMAGPVRVQIFDVGGRLVRTLMDSAPVGTHNLWFDGRDRLGYPLASGVYFVRATSSTDGPARAVFVMMK